MTQGDIDMAHLPHVDRTWTLGTVLAAVGSLLSLVSFIGGMIWFAAELKESTKNIPGILAKQTDLSSVQGKQSQDIAVLQDQQHYTDMRYAEIMSQLAKISEKIDQQNKEFYDRHYNDQHK